jgi:hypothetical protein
MAKKKSLSPRRLRMKRPARLQSARTWLPTYQGRCIIRGYSRWFGVDLVCASRELAMLGVLLDSKRVSENEASAKRKSRAGLVRREQKLKGDSSPSSEISPDRDENFAYIAGYTSNGFAYGVTWEEWEQLDDAF